MMENPSPKLNIDAGPELESIRRSIRQPAAAQVGIPRRCGPDLLEQGKLLLDRLESWLMDGEQKQFLEQRPWTAFFLSATAYLCDIGLMDGDDHSRFPAAANELPEGDGNRAGDLYWRSHKWIRRHWRELGIANGDQAAIIAAICLRMDGTIDEARQAPRQPAFDGARIDTGFVAACLRLSKSMELKAFTTIMEITALSPSGKSTPPHRLIEHFDVCGMGPHPYFPATIQVKISCRHPEVHRALKHHEHTVQQQLTEINQRCRPRFLFSNIIYEIEPEGYQPIDLKFNVDSSAALELFMGNRLYSDKRVFLRELIQNAVDACSLRKLADSTFRPEIFIAFNRDISIVTIRDNGIGMDRHWVEKYFLSIGISFYRSDEIKNINRSSHIDIGFISQFGIGFLSSFLVADKIVIKTRREVSPGLMITITSLRDYFDVRPLAGDQPVGTEVTLHLKKSKINYCRSLEYAGYLKTNIRFLQIPVEFLDEEGNTSFLGNHPLSYTHEKTTESDFVAQLKFTGSEGFLLLSAKMHADHIFALDTAKGGISVFQDGIFVTQLDSLLPEGARANVVGRINLKGEDKCELGMDRNRIFWTGEQKNRIRMLIRHALVDAANQLMLALDRQGAPRTTRNSIINNLAIFFDFSDFDDRMHRELNPAIRSVVEKRFRDFVRIHFAHTLRREGIPEADGYNERWQQEILESFVHRN